MQQYLRALQGKMVKLHMAYNSDLFCYVLLIQRSVRQKESTQDRNSRKRFNYLYSYSRSFFNPHLIKLTYRT